MIRRLAPHGELWASQEVMVKAMREFYPLATRYMVKVALERLTRQGVLLAVGQHTQHVHGQPYLLLQYRTLVSSARRAARLGRKLLRLVEKHKPSEPKINKRDDGRYGHRHQARRRAEKARLIARGQIACFRCGKPCLWNKPFHLDHLDGSDTEYGGISHPMCNIKHQIHHRAQGYFAYFAFNLLSVEARLFDGVRGRTT